jgi:hypothetical protein
VNQLANGCKIQTSTEENMKISRKLLVFAAAFTFAAGSAFYVNSGFVSNAACQIGLTGASACGKCGDGYCNPRCGETATSCPRDCGVTSTK